MLAAPLMAGNDPRKMSDEVRQLLTNREVLAIDQDPLGKQATRFMKHVGKQIWVKELSKGEWAVCFFNDSDATVQLRIDWANLTFLKGTYRIRDIWQKKDLGQTTTGLDAPLAPHDVVLVKLTPIP